MSGDRRPSPRRAAGGSARAYRGAGRSRRERVGGLGGGAGQSRIIALARTGCHRNDIGMNGNARRRSPAGAGRPGPLGSGPGSSFPAGGGPPALGDGIGWSVRASIPQPWRVGRRAFLRGSPSAFMAVGPHPSNGGATRFPPIRHFTTLDAWSFYRLSPGRATARLKRTACALRGLPRSPGGSQGSGRYRGGGESSYNNVTVDGGN
jgi:hypothetical protein